uniref:Calpain catalytic domain-containing protein n=1 Tax=Arion vulgaris TaxID=1028688 RepID=A0A0B7A6W7_9EUPU
MAANYRQKRQEVGGRLASQSQMSGGSQPNLAGTTGTLNRTQVERRPAQFISASRNRLDSDSLIDDRTSPNSVLKRTAKSQDRLNSTSSSIGSNSSRSNFSQPTAKSHAYVDPVVIGNNNRNNVVPHPAGGPNYSNVSNYSTVNKHVDNKDTKAYNRVSREIITSPSSVQNPANISNNRSTALTADNSFYEFEKVRLDYLRRGKLYEDTIFVPSDASVYYSRNPPFRIDWMRAKDIAARNRQNPMFFAEGIDPYDVRQGELGDCWFVAAMACLSSPEHRSLFERVVPAGQSFQDGWYSGVFRFNFWHFGVWKQVLVDDFLPTDRGQLIFVNSINVSEFWPALMEKAYAKLYGSYEALKGGQMVDALTDLSGGIAEEYILRGSRSNLPSNIVNILFKSIERLALIGCSISGVESALLDNGLMTAHAYSVTDVRRILMGQQTVTLIRVRNPHGDSKEWRGRWSERSPEWQGVSPSDRASLGLIQRDDGEFWMDFDDFLANFDNLYICNLTPDSPIETPRKWEAVEHSGRWVKGFSAGGRPSKEASHWANPQYYLRLEDTDEDDDSVCSVLIQLMQVDRRKMKQKGEKFLSVGFNVYQYEKGYSLPLKKDYFDHHQTIANSGAYINTRQVTKRLTFAPGEYVVVPSTWDQDEEADYYIRFFLERGNIVEYCDEKPEKVDIPATVVSPEAKQQEETIKNLFYRLSGEDMELNPFELCGAMNEALRSDRLHRDVSVDACKAFISLMDVDGSGQLGFHEFQFLWGHLRSWKNIFYQFDTNNSGELDSQELRAAINGTGYKVSNKTLASLVFKYADKQGTISMDNFLILMARLMKTFNTFHEIQKDAVAVVSLEQWLDKTLAL